MPVRGRQEQRVLLPGQPQSNLRHQSQILQEEPPEEVLRPATGHSLR